jgi:hypothetical protein
MRSRASISKVIGSHLITGSKDSEVAAGWPGVGFIGLISARRETVRRRY